jgi:FAD/FMN-containing dehydrogenase
MFLWAPADLSGGLSYLSTQYGWAADNIVEAEVVLANGTIVIASNTTNVDLFNVLRGGGNNFGIVTTYTLQTYPMGEVSLAVLAIGPG